MNTQPSAETLIFQKASLVIDKSDLVHSLEAWLANAEHDLALTDIDMHTLLSGWLATAFAGLPLDEENVAAMLRHAPIEFEVSAADLHKATRQVLSALASNPLPHS